MGIIENEKFLTDVSTCGMDDKYMYVLHSNESQIEILVVVAVGVGLLHFTVIKLTSSIECAPIIKKKKTQFSLCP